MRALDLYGYARLAVAEQTDATRAALEAYADGVNAWLRVVQRDALGRGAPEFFLFSPDIAPWTPADSIAVQKLMALQHDRQGGDGDAAGAVVAGAAAGAAGGHPAGFPERAGDGAAAVLRAFPRCNGTAGGHARRGGRAALRSAAAAGARRGLQRLCGHRPADGRRRADPCHRSAPGAERALDLDAGADGSRRRAGDGRAPFPGSRR